MWSALGTIIVCAVYVSVGVLGILLRPAKENLLQQVDPYLAILEALISLARANKTRSDGVRGRLIRTDGRIGRFGWKATVPTVREFVACRACTVADTTMGQATGYKPLAGKGFGGAG